MQRYAIAALAALFGIGLTVACTVNFDPAEPGVFPCENDDDCIEGQVCQKNKNGNKVCREKGEEEVCIDQDDDGYGSEKPTVNCPACQKGLRNGCEVDCDDTVPKVNPGQYEKCDGNVDNDCDGKTDEPIGVADCSASDTGSASCPLTGVRMPPQSGTVWGCATIDGTPQCVVKGSFRTSQKCKSKQGFGKCEGGSWTSVPKECTQ